MENLIDFNIENCSKLSSPLIPPPQSTPTHSAVPRLSDVCNNPFDKVLRAIENKNDPFESKSETTPKNTLKNNSFYNDSQENIHLISPITTPSFKLKKQKQRSNIFGSISLEANQLAEMFKTLSEETDTNYEDISQCIPPWVEEEINFDDSEEESNNKIIEYEIADYLNDEKQYLKPERSDKDLPCVNIKHLEENDESLKNEKQVSDSESFDDTETKTAKELLHHLKAVLNNTGTVADKKKLGENLLNSLASALNIENPSRNNSPTESIKRSKSDSKINLKNKTIHKEENKLAVRKITTRPAAPLKLEKNLKVRNEKDKNGTKGPLKAFIPLTNMAKNRKSTTPPKQTHSKIKTQNTPNKSKYTPPMAQSTPEISKEIETKKKPLFRCSVSPLNTNNVSNSGLKLNKSDTNSSISTFKSMTRRNSVSDMSTSKCETDKLSRPVTLKRNSSFQYNTPTTSISQINPPLKRYGLPVKLKPLKLVPKANQSSL